jgi:hypothetical protein
MTRTETGSPPSGTYLASIPKGGERRVHRALERRHQVRLPLISTRGRVQIGSGVGLHVQYDPAGELLVDRLLGIARQTDGVGGPDEVGGRIVLPEQPRHTDREEVRLACAAYATGIPGGIVAFFAIQTKNIWYAGCGSS